MPQWVVWVFMDKLAPFLRVERPGGSEEDEKEGKSIPSPNSKCRAVQ